MQIMATNLEVHRGRTYYAAPSLNFMFVPSSRNKHAVAKCCAQLGQVGKCNGKCRVVGCEEVRGGGVGGGALREMLPSFCGFL